MESTAALASPEAANQTRERDAQNATQKRNLAGFGSKDGKISLSWVVSKNPFEEALVEVDDERKRRPSKRWNAKNDGFDLRTGCFLWATMESFVVTWPDMILKRFSPKDIEDSDNSDAEAAIEQNRAEGEFLQMFGIFNFCLAEN